MAYNDTSKITIPLVLGDKESKLKVGKILDPIVHENSLINTTDGKSYTITEKRNNKQDNQYIGTYFAEQTSKYIILKYNESTKRLEAYPATEWFSFKKNIKVRLSELNEDDDKRKKQKSIIDLFKKKGVVEPVKKQRKKKGPSLGGSNLLSNTEPEEEEIPEEHEEEAKNESDEGFSSEEDPELKDIPSDIEEGLNMKKEKTKLEKVVLSKMKEEEEEDLSKMKKEEEEEEDENDDDNDSYAIDEEIEKADSDVDEEVVDKELLGLKRGRDEDDDE